jgi:hypothetical protein
VHACSQFIYIENLVLAPEAKDDQSLQAGPAGDRSLVEDRALMQLLRNAVDQVSEIDGWSHLSKVGKYISNTSSFSPINYGYRKLGEVLRASGTFDIEMRSDNTAMYVEPRAPQAVIKAAKPAQRR